MAEKEYCGKAKRIETRFGEMFKISIAPDDLEKIIQSANASGWVNLIMSEMKNEDRRGNTHTIYIDDWKPDGGNRSGDNRGGGYSRGRSEDDQPSRRAYEPPPMPQGGEEEDDFPF